MCFVIGHAHNVVLVARAEKEEMVEGLSWVESYSHQLEDQVASLSREVDLLKLEIASSLEETNQFRHEVEVREAKQGSLLACLSQMEKEVES